MNWAGFLILGEACFFSSVSRGLRAKSVHIITRRVMPVSAKTAPHKVAMPMVPRIGKVWEMRLGDGGMGIML